MGLKLASKINQNPSKIEAQDGLPLSIDFWWVLGGMLGWKIEPRAKKKSIEKRIEKMMKKRCLLAAPGGVGSSDARGRGRVSGTP